MNKNRIEWIDLYKSIGIILMIIGHIGVNKNTDIIIYAFNMPMFFFISGYLYKNKNENFKTYTKKKTKTLLFPYLIFGLFHWIIYNIKNQCIDIETLKSLFFINTDRLPIAGALWFLTALFFVETIYFLIDNYIKNKKIKYSIIFIISIIGNLWNNITNFRLPYSIDVAFVGIGLYTIGNLIKNNSKNSFINKFINMDKKIWIILFPISLTLIYINGYINMRASIYTNIPLFWINSILMSILLLNMSKYIENTNIKNNILYKFIISIGTNSITYVVLNQIVILFAKIIIKKIIKILIIQKILVLIISLIILYVINITIKNSKFKSIIGL